MTPTSDTNPTPPSTAITISPPPARIPSNPPTPQPQPDPPNPRLQSLATKKATLESTLSDLLAERTTLVASFPNPTASSDAERTKAALESANATIKSHIALLHSYNEIKDIGQGLMGLIAESRGARVREVMEEMGMGEGD